MGAAEVLSSGLQEFKENATLRHGLGRFKGVQPFQQGDRAVCLSKKVNIDGWHGYPPSLDSQICEQRSSPLVGRRSGSINWGWRKGKSDACVVRSLARKIVVEVRWCWDRKSFQRLLALHGPAVQSKSGLSAVPVVGGDMVSAGRHGG